MGGERKGNPLLSMTKWCAIAFPRFSKSPDTMLHGLMAGDTLVEGPSKICKCPSAIALKAEITDGAHHHCLLLVHQ